MTAARVGRGVAFAVAVVFVLVGAWMILSPSGFRAALRNANARWNAGASGAISIATGIQNGGYYKLGSELALAVAATGPYTLAPVETTGSLDNLKRLREGTVNFGLMQGGLLGNPEVDGAAESPVLPVANIDRQYLHLIVPVDSTIHTLRDLAGKRIGVGPAGSGHEALAQLVVKYFAFPQAPVLVNDHSPDLDQAFQSGGIDAAFAVYSLFAPAMEDLFKTGDFRLVPIPEAEALAKFLPGISAEDLPPSLYGPERTVPPVVDGPFPTLMVNTFLVARRDAPEAQVRAILEALYSPGFRYSARLTGLDEQHGRVSPLAPLHPAAAAWYARREPLSSDRFEVASFFLAGLVTLAGMVQYLLGRRAWLHSLKSRRAIRPYFERLLEYGAAVEATSDTSALNAILHDMMATQREAEHEWLAGRLNTEHMENLYLIYNTRTRNAFDKIHQLHLQALIEGGPVPASYHPEPARPVLTRLPQEPPRATIFDAPREDFYSEPAPAAVVYSEPEPVAMPTPAPAPRPAPPVMPAPVASAPSSISAPRVRQKKHRGGPKPDGGTVEDAPQEAPARPAHFAPQPVAPQTAAPRQLAEWEIEQKYQRTSDTISDFESGIVSAPRPRRKDTPQDASAPARASLNDDSDNDAPQLDLFHPKDE